MNEETHKLSIEPELEARIVALVLGEASDFETEELERLLRSRPELAAFKLEMEQVTQLLHEVGHQELETPDANWRLSNERRQVVLDVIQGKVTTNTMETREVAVSEPPRFRRRRWMRVLEATVATAILIVLIGLMLPAVQMSRESARRLAKAESMEAPKSWDSEPVPSSEPSSAVNMDSNENNFSFYMGFVRDHSMSSDNRSRQNSTDALAAIRESVQLSTSGPAADPSANLFSEPPTSGSPQILAPQLTPPQHWSAPSDESGMVAENSRGSTVMLFDGSSNSMSYSLILPDPGYSRGLGTEPAGTDKSVASIPAQPEILAGVPLGNIDSGVVGKAEQVDPKPTGVPTHDFRILDSIANPSDADARGWSVEEAETESIVSDNENQPIIAGGSGPAGPPVTTQPGFAKDNLQQGQGLAENGLVPNFGVQVPDPTTQGTEHFYRNSINGRDAAGEANGNMGGMVGGTGGGGMDGRSGLPDGGLGGMGGGMGGGNVGQVTPRFGTEFGNGVPSGDEQDATKLALGQSAPAKPGSASVESFDLPMEMKNEAGEVVAGEKKLAEMNGDAYRFITPETRRKQLDDQTSEGREEKGLKQQSAEGLWGRQSGIQLESQLQRGGQTDQKELVRDYESEPEVDRLAGDGLDRKKGRSTRSREAWEKGFLEADREKQDAWMDQAPQSRPEDIVDLAKKPNYKREAPSAGLNETNAATESFSTFSLHVSDVSFKLAAAALARGEWPEAAKIRIEEFVNAFDYGDPLPGTHEKVACVVEQAIHPFLQQRNVLRVSMRTSAEGRSASTPLRLTLVLDNSGSMERIDRQQAVQRALSLLAQQLSPNDQVTLISFARQPRLLAENVAGQDAARLVELIAQLPSEGGTNIEAALKLAFEKAAAQQAPGVQNRIVLLTDGAVNLGNANPESLSRMVETMRTAGIAFDAAGISAEGLNDEVLEALTRKGDGRYYLLDGEESSGGRFAQQIAGALRPSASNVKVQIEFNPKRVGQYKLLGFEKHILQQEDFRNDAVDAAELAAAEAGVALYQFEAKPDGEGDVGTVSVRFRDLTTGEMVEQRWPIPYEANALRPDQATDSIRLATAAAMLAARLRGEALGETVDLKALSELTAGLSEQQDYDPRVQQLKLMIEQARQLSQQ